jgi:hypothetical protein
MATPNPFQELERIYLLDGFELILERLRSDFRVFADTYFDQNQTTADHDKFFGAFTPIWLDLIRRRHYFKAIKIWQFALGLAVDWQRRNRPSKIHKGTPYYFLGVTAILNNELENGFLAFHQAMKEDQRLAGRRTPEAPAYWFATLDSSRQNQFFKLKVEQMAMYLSERLEEYSTNRGGSLRVQDFRRRFLRLKKLREEVFYFVYLMFKLKKLVKETHKVYKKNIFSSLLHAKLLFDFCLISDKVIENKNPAHSSRHLSFWDEMMFLSSPNIALLSFNRRKLSTINRDFERNFTTTMYDLLLGRYHLSLSDIEKDFAIAYGIRNFAAHKIQNQKVLYNRMIELAQSILNTLFFTVEKLY